MTKNAGVSANKAVGSMWTSERARHSGESPATMRPVARVQRLEGEPRPAQARPATLPFTRVRQPHTELSRDVTNG